MGWTAATGELGAGGWVLFTILFFWQLPHFMAIAWMYRDDYARGGFRMLPVVDPAGRRTGMAAVRHTVALMGFSLAPVAMGLAGRWYAGIALAMGLAFLACAVVFAARLTRDSARRLFLASILYLPVLLSVLVADRTPANASQRVLAARTGMPTTAAGVSASLQR
jgi:protoheme IX farnesyltransferase